MFIQMVIAPIYYLYKFLYVIQVCAHEIWHHFKLHRYWHFVLPFWALSAISFSSHACEYYTPTIKHYAHKTSTLHEASYIVNNLIHEEIEKQLTARKNPSCPYPLSLSIDTQLQHINPQLWDFLNSITATVCEQKHLISGRESNTGKHLKQVRIYYIYAFYNYVPAPSNQNDAWSATWYCRDVWKFSSTTENP